MNTDISIEFKTDLDFDKSLTQNEYLSKIISLLEPILKQQFSNDLIKQKIRPYKDRINFSCPYCSDSQVSSYKKRGNIILEGEHKNHFKCFNCGIFLKIDKFFKDFKTDLDLGFINYVSYSNLNISSNKYDISVLMDINKIEQNAIERDLLKNKFGLVEVKKSPIWSWLVKRLQFQEEKFLYNPNKDYLLILNLTPTNKIIGAQKRLFKGFNKYITFSANRLHELLNLTSVPDDVNTISQLFNILNVNFNAPITIFEGPLDSFLFKNSIANCGLNKKFPFDINVRYFFDDDKDGIKKSMELLSKGETVFLWDKFKKDLNMPYKKKNDLNDVKKWAKQSNIILPNLDKYFSNDPLDIIDL